MTMKKLWHIFLIFLILVYTYFNSVNHVTATVMVGEIESYGKTYINYFMNHNYIPRDKLYLFEYSVKALEKARMQLVKEGKLEEKWVVWEIPSSTFELKSDKTIIEKKEKCELSYGESSGIYPARELDKCYSIYYVGNTSYQSFLALLLTLPQLSDQNSKIIIDSLDQLSNNFQQQIRTYSGGIYFSKPVWSLDSKFVAFGIWNDGIFNYEVYDISNEKYLKTDILKQDIATEPIWFPTGRYLAFGSLSEINIFDVITGKTDNINISHLISGQNYELLLSYDTNRNKILFAFDTNLLSNYDIYEIDLKTKNIQLRTKDVGYLSWRKDIDRDSLKKATSPDGQYEATVEDRVEGSIKTVNKITNIDSQISKVGIESKEESPTVNDKKVKYVVLLIMSFIGLVGTFLFGWFMSLRYSKKGALNNQ